MSPPVGARQPPGRRRWSLRRQLLVVLTGLMLPLLVVGPTAGVLLRSSADDHDRSTERVLVSAQVSDLQERVAALTSSLTVRELLQNDPVALLALLTRTQDVERGFAALRPRIPTGERGEIDQAYAEWQSLVTTLALLPQRFQVLLTEPGQLLLTLNDLGPRLLRIAQVLSEAAAMNAQALRAELDRAHLRQRVWLLQLAGLALAGLLAAVVMARWLYRRINAPLVALQQAAQRMGQDDLAVRIPEDRTPEFGALAVAFNQMADGLQDGRAQLSNREQHFRALVQHASDVVAVVDVATVVSYVTPSVARVLQVSAQELCGSRLLDSVHPDDQHLVAAVVDAVSGTPGLSDTVGCRLRAGADPSPGWRNAQLVIHNLCAEPAVGGLVVTVRDETEQVRLHEQLRHSALHDELTGLANRTLLTDRLGHAMAGRDQPPVVLYCDLDGFKAVNDSLGHAAGDAMLRAVADRLTSCLRSRDTAARLGGDEFVVLLEGVTQDEAHEAAQRLLTCVSQPLTLAGVEVSPALSVGVAGGPAASPEELLRQADAAMYQAKTSARHDNSGRRSGAVAVYDALLAADLVNRLELRSDLQQALARREFVLHYQPTVDLLSGGITGIEALVRWQHPTRGLVPPADFIAMTEETGLIIELGLWVLDAACAQVQQWHGCSPRLHLNVNLSGRQLEYAGIVDDVAGVLARTGLDPSQLTLELTESVLLDRSEDVLGRLHALKALGLTLAIDDFGTGYSSLSYLQRLPVDVLKIDKSFVDPLAVPGRPGPDSGLAATIITMARTLGLRSVAEGIEHACQADRLRGLGCDVGQGYLYSRPVPADELERLLHEGGERGHEVPLAVSST